jgi:hypothetical protein
MADSPKAQSSAFSSYDYDPESSSLSVTWARSGQTWVYDNVPQWKVSAMERAPSSGNYLMSDIVGKHSGRKV